jgi:hypothetical protein
MTLIPEVLFSGLILIALCLTAAGGIGLLVLLARDWKGGKLW